VAIFTRLLEAWEEQFLMLFQVLDNGTKERRGLDCGVFAMDEIIDLDPAVLAKHNATFRLWTLEDTTHPL
jgi:hypothetical protein